MGPPLCPSTTPPNTAQVLCFTWKHEGGHLLRARPQHHERQKSGITSPRRRAHDAHFCRWHLPSVCGGFSPISRPPLGWAGERGGRDRHPPLTQQWPLPRNDTHTAVWGPKPARDGSLTEFTRAASVRDVQTRASSTSRENILHVLGWTPATPRGGPAGSPTGCSLEWKLNWGR